jgi:hypothetical protein
MADRRRRFVPALALIALACAAVALTPGGALAKRAPRVLRVGTYKGVKGQFNSIQAAVNKAKPGDWILVGPGVYHERNDRKTGQFKEDGPPPAGVLITKNDIHLRGMNRKKVVVDGTHSHKGKACSSNPGVQNLGVIGTDGKPQGRNGIVVFKANNTRIDNLTVCNFLSGSSGQGNEIWWNGGDGSGRIGMGAFKGTYLSATTTFYGSDDIAASYGIFSSNSSGPGTIYQTYSSNFSDSDYYIGACQQVCNQTLDKAWGEYSPLGYSGTNSGGPLVVKNSQFDNNTDGFDTNSQNNDDAPSPQDGGCPGGAISPITHTHSCWVFMNNFVHDNNNANVPHTGTASIAPVGTGMSVSGGRNDTIMNNRFVHNGAWGVLFIPFPDSGNPPPIAHCEGGVQMGPPFGCLYDDWGNALLNNQFSGNGFFGNPTNSDFGEITFFPGNPVNCYSGNQAPDGSSPSNLQQTNPACGPTGSGNLNPPLLNEVACNTQQLGSPCSPTDKYPRRTGVVMHKLPNKQLKNMPHPCKGVPRDPWCQ